jgi:hypothetical protein
VFGCFPFYVESFLSSIADKIFYRSWLSVTVGYHVRNRNCLLFVSTWIHPRLCWWAPWGFRLVFWVVFLVLFVFVLCLLIVNSWPGSIDCPFLTWVYWLSILDLGLLIVHSWPGSIDCQFLTWVYWLSILDLGLLIVHSRPGSIDCPFLT